MTIIDEISTKPVMVPGFEYALPRVVYVGPSTIAGRSTGPQTAKPKREWRQSLSRVADSNRVLDVSHGQTEFEPTDGLKHLLDETGPACPSKTSFDNLVRKILKEFDLKAWKARASDDVSRPLLLRSNEYGGHSDLTKGRWIASPPVIVEACFTFIVHDHGGPARCAVSPELRADWISRIEAVGRLERGWNGYKAPVPSARAVKNAKDLFEVACDRDIMPERVDASGMGGLGMVFTEGTREVVAELYNNGTAHALFADHATEEMDTRPISSTAEGYYTFLNEVHQYLYGQAPAR